MNDQDDLLVGDNPISDSKDDLLGRASIAQAFAKDILDIDASAGLVVGVLGAWGNGKTSFVGLMLEEFRRESLLPIVEFNPWMFSGAQPLTETFFRELAAELRIDDSNKFDAIAKHLNDYGDVLSPLAVIPMFGGWWDRAFKAGKSFAQFVAAKKRGSSPIRQLISDELSKLTKPIIVVIDDIDRLSTEEIRDVFKLVRLTASFPQIVYLLAFDRPRVEKALDARGVKGRDYLEKIVQLSFDVPSISPLFLRKRILDQTGLIIEGIDRVRFNEDIWLDVYLEVIEPLLKNLRDVNRFVLSARSTLRALGSRIETVDLLALESIRIFRPHLFDMIKKTRLALTEVERGYGLTPKAAHKQQIDALLHASGTDEPVIRDLIRRIFPSGLQHIENTRYGSEWLDIWRRNHRLAHLSYLDLYLSRSVPPDVEAFDHAETLFEVMADEESFNEYLDEIGVEQLEDVIAGLEAYEDDYPTDAVVPASVSLMNRVTDIVERPRRGVTDLLTPDLVVSRVVIRLFRRLPEERERDEAARKVFARIDTASAQQLFLRAMGVTRDEEGRRLVSAEVADELSNALAARLNDDNPLDYSREFDLLRLYVQNADSSGEGLRIVNSTDVNQFRALLASARSDTISQFGDTRRVRREPRLAWDALTSVLGGAEKIALAVEHLRDVDGSTELVLLAEKYVGGWRPEEN